MAAANDLLTDALARIGESVPDVLESLGTDDAAWRPDAEANSIGWLVWHLTRVLDSHLADAAGEQQVLARDGYDERLGLDLPAGDTGYAHGSDEVARVRFSDLAELTAYHRAVQEWAASYLAGVTDFDRVVDERWDPPVTLGVRLVSVVDDCARHVGQAQYVRGMLERRA